MDKPWNPIEGPLKATEYFKLIKLWVSPNLETKMETFEKKESSWSNETNNDDNDENWISQHQKQ